MKLLKRNYLLFLVLGIFIILLGVGIVYKFNKINDNNIGNNIKLADTTCTNWGKWGQISSEIKKVYTGQKCPSVIPTTGSATYYECWQSDPTCDGNGCYTVLKYQRKCNDTGSTTTDNKKNECTVNHCLECYASPSNNRCKKCDTGYKLEGYGYSCVWDNQETAGDDKCDVPNCEKCVKGKSYVCSLCNSGYMITSGGSCTKCKTGQISNNSRTACYYPNSSTPTDKCYKDSMGNYVTGNFNNQQGYTLISNDIKSCNNVIIKLVDNKGTVLTGATFNFEDATNPINNKTINIGQVEISLLTVGNYSLKETLAPTGYKLEDNAINIIVNDDGTINVASAANIDLGISNGTRNITLSIINEQDVVTPITTPEEKCYVKYGNGTDNDYCYGTIEDKCQGYTEVVNGRDETTCNEDKACYLYIDGSYKIGKYYYQQGFQYAGATCPACYEGSNGEYRWTNTPMIDEKIVNGINAQNLCVTPQKSNNSKLLYIILIIVVVIIIAFVLKSIMGKNNNKNYSSEY